MRLWHECSTQHLLGLALILVDPSVRLHVDRVCWRRRIRSLFPCSVTSVDAWRCRGRPLVVALVGMVTGGLPLEKQRLCKHRHRITTKIVHAWSVCCFCLFLIQFYFFLDLIKKTSLWKYKHYVHDACSKATNKNTVHLMNRTAVKVTLSWRCNCLFVVRYEALNYFW